MEMADRTDWRARDIQDEDVWQRFLNKSVRAECSQRADNVQPSWHDVRYTLMAGWCGNGLIPHGLQSAPYDIPKTVLAASDLITTEHQTSGHMCIPMELVAWKVEIQPRLDGFFDDLVARYYQSCLNYSYTDQADIVPYRQRLARVGLTTECVEGERRVPLTEGLYPFDFTSNNTQIVAHAPAGVLRHAETLAPWYTAGSLTYMLIADNCD